MKKLFFFSFIVLLFACKKDNAVTSGTDDTADSLAVTEQQQASKYPTNVYFGDTHLHTALSMADMLI